MRGDKRLGVRALTLQAVATLLLWAPVLVVESPAFIWAGVGAAIATSATGIAVWGTFGPYQAAQPQKILGRLLLTEGLRWGMVLVLLSLALNWIDDPQPFPLFVALLGVWLIPALLALGSRPG